MANPSSINLGDVSGGGSALNAASASAMDNRLRHIISASCSVVSANSRSSSSTKSSSATAAAAMGGWAAGLMVEGGPEATETLTMQQLPSDSSHNCGVAPFEGNKEDGDGNEDLHANGSASASCAAVATHTPAVLGGFDGGNPMILQMGAPLHPVAEFLFQLTKMLTDNNTEFIEWRNASIFVHDPPGLEREILPRYFRHSNYSSFQRQMNYFGFRKIAGKGKMAPCSYVNEHAKEDISSLLFIKRKKTGISSAAAKLLAQQNRINRSMGLGGMGIAGNALGMIGYNHGGMGGAAGVPGAGATLSLNNFAMLGGVPAMEGAGNVLSASSSLNDQASLLREQQNILAQLQQAHALAMTNTGSLGMAGSAQGGISQLTQSKLNGLSMNSVVNAGLLTNDQGNVYMSSNIPSNSAGADAATTQSLLMQQATSSVAADGNLPQAGMSGPPSAGGNSGNLVRVDSAANLRALINAQISMFSTPGDPFSWSTMNTIGSSLGSQMPSSQQGGRFSSIPTGTTGLLYDWNEILQRSANMAGVGSDNFDLPGAGPNTISIRQLEQQLLQGSNSEGAATAPIGQSFNFGGIFGTGAGGVPQGFQQGYQT
ncbi:hypothetical protein ACHAW5_005929 [Stephanodiscus triporus]|uniref:HSF-type DNA-binding domain-containing protein n=1 Tax=Stephanodiscus triporus TaxID=2934178 RepID=A0ABD3N736_9STRA